MRDDVRAAVERLIEAASVEQKWRELERTVERGRAAVAEAFVAQGRVFGRAFGEMRPYFVERYLPQSRRDAEELREAATIPDDVWHRLWGDVSGEMLRLMLAPVVDLNELGLTLGAGALAAALGQDFAQAFSLANPRAVAYLEQHGAALVTKINEETRSQMRTLVRQAADEGWSYTRTAKAIRERFEGFAGLKPQHHIRDRATLVAVTEAGQAYEEGSRIVAMGLAESGIPMEKYWRTSGDERVSQGCRDNQAAGWIAVAEMFPSGHERPLRFPGCRCTAQYRRARGAQTGQASARTTARDWGNTSLAELSDVADMERWAAFRHPHVQFDFRGTIPENIRPALDQFDKLARAYPEVASRLRYMGTYGTDDKVARAGLASVPDFGTAYAHASLDGKFMGLNPKHFGSPNLAEALKRNLQSNWLDGDGTIQSLTTHEFGHLVDGWLQTRHKAAFTEYIGLDGFGLIGDTFRMWREQNKATAKLSQYSKTDMWENFAEGFSAIHHKPRGEWPVYVRRLDALLSEFGRAREYDDWKDIPWLDQVPWDERGEVGKALNAIAKGLNIKR